LKEELEEKGMIEINEREITALRELARQHIKRIMIDTSRLIEYMKAINNGDVFSTLLTLYTALKILEEIEEEENKEEN